jgi:hypothetical protein
VKNLKQERRVAQLEADLAFEHQKKLEDGELSDHKYQLLAARFDQRESDWQLNSQKLSYAEAEVTKLRTQVDDRQKDIDALQNQMAMQDKALF